MDTKVDYLVTSNIQSNPLATDEISCRSLSNVTTSIDESILDLSQRSFINEKNFIDNWNESFPCNYTDQIDEDDHLHRLFIPTNDQLLNIEQSLTDQLKPHSNPQHLLSDNPPSQMDFYSSKKRTKIKKSLIVIHELESSVHSSSNFTWSNYFSLIGERSVSEEFFDHYLASIESGLKEEMIVEYCYDIDQQFYWKCQIQFVSNRLLRLHFLGISNEQISTDFWALFSHERCHPIGWCEQNSKSLIPPPNVSPLLSTNENHENYPTPAEYLFNQDVGLTPVEQIQIGMIFEIADRQRPWTLWFVRVMNNRGGRLHLRYINSMEDGDSSMDIHVFYLDRRVHPVGWTSNNSPHYFYEFPLGLTSIISKEELMEYCLNQSKNIFYPPNLFKEQEDIPKHRFTEGMKLEVFDMESQHIHIGRIGIIHNEFYFDVLIDNDDGNERSFVAHATHPHVLPAHWAAERKLALMNGKGIRQSEDYWNFYTEKNGMADLAPERCFNLITLNSAGANQVEPGMKMEMISTIKNEDFVFSVTLIHVADHLLWLRIDDPMLFHPNPHLFYRVLPINSLDIFPIGWAKFNGFQLIKPIEYQMNIKTYQRNHYDLFSSVTHYPQIPRVYLNEIYQLTIYVNIRCYSGPHFCSSRLARIPSQFGPGPYGHVLIDMFHHLLSTTSTNAHRALRRLDQQTNPRMTTENVKAAKKSSKLIRPISFPNEARLVHHYLRHICTQLEACPNLFSIKHFDQHCPDKCYLLNNTFAFSTHSKHKRTQLRAAQNRYRKQKFLLGHLKSATPSSPTVEEPVANEMTTILSNDDLPQTTTTNNPLPGSDRQTRGFRVHIEPKTHTVTRTNKKQKIKQEPVQIETKIVEPSKRSRNPRPKRSLSPAIVTPPPLPIPLPPPPPPAMTLSILSNKKSKKRRPLPSSESSNYSLPKVELAQTSTPLIRYPIAPPIDPLNPVTWNVNDVCWYLNKSGCSFALEVIKEQEIDGAALLLLDDLDTVQNLLEFKLGPAVKFFHVVEQLRTQVIDTFNSSSTSALRTSSRLSTK